MAVKDWSKTFKPLLAKYQGTPHPLEFKNTYQLMVMVILAAQSTDKLTNSIAGPLFNTFPNFESLVNATPEVLYPFIGKIRNFRNKSKWIIDLAHIIKSDKNIPTTLDELTKLPGIGRKSANVILREVGKKAEGVIVDLHVVRVAPRIGIATGTDPKKIEKQIMEAIPQKHWGEIGMAISFLGREICRPTGPKCEECVMKSACMYNKKKKLS